MEQQVRIDKWLWAVRIFKTRALAAEACSRGRITINDVDAKPSRMVRPGDCLVVHKPPVRFTYVVNTVVDHRLPAKEAIHCYVDKTPENEKNKLKHRDYAMFRPQGAGRPTKKERREIDRILNQQP